MTIVAVIIGLVCGVAGTYAYSQYRRATSRHQSEQTVAAAKNKARAVVLAAKDKALKITDDAKREEAELRKGLKTLIKSLTSWILGVKSSARPRAKSKS